MPCIHKTDLNAGTKRLNSIIWMRYKQINGTQCLLHGIERHIRLCSRSFGFSIPPFGFKLLNMGTVSQHNAAKGGGRIGCMDASCKSTGKKQRQQTGMVNVCMRQQNVVNFSGGARNSNVFIGISPLLHSKIN